MEDYYKQFYLHLKKIAEIGPRVLHKCERDDLIRLKKSFDLN